jgi:DNA-binding NarL/FixJ family response regulator
MTNITGFEISRMLREQDTRIKVVIVSESFNPAFLQTAKDLCFDGYISKDVGYSQFVSMFRSILSDGQYFPSFLQR